MMENAKQFFQDDLYAGLSALAETAFPKHCPTCRREFKSAQEFLLETEKLGNRSGLKQSQDDDHVMVELFRNCPCGSTLLECFRDRRDTSEAGLTRRKRFGELLDHLIGLGMDATVARTELLKIAHGQPSEILIKLRILPPGKNA